MRLHVAALHRRLRDRREVACRNDVSAMRIVQVAYGGCSRPSILLKAHTSVIQALLLFVAGVLVHAQFAYSSCQSRLLALII